MFAAGTGRVVSRRVLLAGAVAGAGVATGGAVAVGRPGRGESAPEFFGTHQAGIVTPPLPYVSIAGFDVVGSGPGVLARLLRTWTAIAADLTTSAGEQSEDRPPDRLTVTFGFGPSLFTDGRFGIAERRPDALVPLPAFAGESLDPAAGNGDLCVQACAGSPTVAHHAVRALLNAARDLVKLRWRQTGFRDAGDAADPRGMFGFRDGTHNLDVHDQRETARHLWVSDGPTWLHRGTYLVVRRIRLLLDTWDRTAVAEQETIIGRRRDSNARFVAPLGAHTSLASAERNGGAKLLRRPFTYDAGVDPNGLLDTGLIFICFQRDPGRQFVPIQRRLAADDALNGFSQHLASGVFACPPGAREGSFIGAELLS